VAYLYKFFHSQSLDEDIDLPSLPVPYLTGLLSN